MSDKKLHVYNDPDRKGIFIIGNDSFAEKVKISRPVNGEEDFSKLEYLTDVPDWGFKKHWRSTYYQKSDYIVIPEEDFYFISYKKRQKLNAEIMELNNIEYEIGLLTHAPSILKKIDETSGNNVD